MTRCSFEGRYRCILYRGKLAARMIIRSPVEGMGYLCFTKSANGDLCIFKADESIREFVDQGRRLLSEVDI